MRVTIDGISKSFGDTRVLDDLSLTLPEGRITVILGPSGCGKTTLLRILAGLAEPDAGRIELGGRLANDPRSRLPAEKRGVGMVFQDALLWPHLRVRGNIAFPLGTGRGSDPRVAAAAKAAEIDGFLDRYPGELSGGERRRASLARAIVSEPRLLLLDEPLSGLDANLRVRLLGTIRTIQRSLGVTACSVTHDQEEALGVADLVVVMREGRVLQAGTPEEVYRTPATAFVARFVGLSNLLEGEVADGTVSTPVGSYAANGLEPGPGLFAVRPEALRITADGVPGKVLHSAYRGDRWLLTVSIREREVLVYDAEPRRAGAEVALGLVAAPVPVVDDGDGK